jgi:hypothetical protein
MRAAALMLIGLVLCVVEWGSCFSGPPSNQNETITSRHEKENYLTIEEANEMMQIMIDKKIKEAIGDPHSPSSNTDDSLSSEKIKISIKSSVERKVKESRRSLGNKRKERSFNRERKAALEPSYETFHSLQNASAFVDKTNFTILFLNELSPVCAILRPRRTGKSMLLKMLWEFFCVPRIDVDSYNPETGDHKNITFTAKSTFERTFVYDPDVRKDIIGGKTDGKDSDSFIRDNMNKWPVIFVSMFSVNFGSTLPSLNKIEEKLSKYAVRQAFKEYDYVLFIKMADKICKRKYGAFSRNNIDKFYVDLNLHTCVDMEDIISTMWDFIGEKMDPIIQDFYRFYKGMPPFDSVTDSLKILSEILSDFYKKKVIVLVDEHDAPALHLYSEISLDDPKGNTKIIKSIHHYAKTATALLGNVAKENKYIEKFLMCGVSNSVIDAPYSGFNNLRVYNVFDSTYSKFFSLSKQEVNETVNFLFKEIRPELRKNIISNIDRWYNGYYGKDTSPMYATFSTGQYLNACFKEFTDLKIHPNETSNEWIPEPERYWATSSVTNVLNSYLNIGFEGQFNYILKCLLKEKPAEFDGLEKGFVPLLENPSDSDKRGKILINLLLHGGFLTIYGDKKNKLVKIPNLELTDLFHSQLDEYLSGFPISKQ